MSDPKYRQKYFKAQVMRLCGSTPAENETEGQPT